MKLLPFRPAKNSGLSFIEVITVASAVAVIISVAASVTTNVSSRVAEQKLVSEVESINRAIRIYEASGGDLTTTYPHPWWILGALKNQVAAADQDASTGFTGSLIDKRLQPVFMTVAEMTTDEPRTLWNTSTRQFEVSRSNTESGLPIKGFKVTDDNWIDKLVTQVFANKKNSQRNKRAYDFAKEGSWVWDYQDRSASGGNSPTEVDLTLAGTPTSAGLLPGLSRLDPPTFTLAGGKYLLTSYPLATGLSNPNDEAVSEVWYSTGLGSWYLYDGTPITVSPGSVVQAYAKSTDTENWVDSYFTGSEYGTNPVALELGVSGPASVNWMEAGGAVEPGGPGTPLASDGVISLSNAGVIPDGYENSLNFMVYWTVDGSDPSSSGTRTQGGAFSGGFGGESVEVSLADWGTQTSFPIQVFAESLDGELFLDSAIESHTVDIAPVELREPMISFGSQQAMINLESIYGDMPSGARIYYTTDGTDPGSVGGEPATGALYAGPFAPPVAATITSRVYGPAGYTHWFNVSDAGSFTIPPPTPLNIGVFGPAGVTYFQIGGSAMSGGPATAQVGPAVISLANAGAIPDEDENSDNFSIFWTTDGSDPTDEANGNRNEGDPFAGGFPDEEVSLALAEWGSQTSFPIQAAAVSKDIYAYADSAVVSNTIGINPVTLRNPLITNNGNQITINFNASFGDMPTGARIYYSKNGTDPGVDGNGNPVSGTLYSGQFNVGKAGDKELVARVYAPASYLDWFEASNLAVFDLYDPWGENPNNPFGFAMYSYGQLNFNSTKVANITGGMRSETDEINLNSVESLLVNGNIDAKKRVYMNSTYGSVNGDITSEVSITTGSVNVTGTKTIGPIGSSNLFVLPAPTGTSDPNYKGPITIITGNYTISGNLALNGTIYATGNITIGSSANITGSGALVAGGSITANSVNRIGSNGSKLFLYSVGSYIDFNSVDIVTVNGVIYAPSVNGELRFNSTREVTLRGGVYTRKTIQMNSVEKLTVEPGLEHVDVIPPGIVDFVIGL